MNEALKSISLIQNFTEVVVICPEEVLKKVEKKVSHYLKPVNFRVIVEEKPGIYTCMNQGIKLIKSKHVAFINDDDFLHFSIVKNIDKLLHELQSCDVLLNAAIVRGEKSNTIFPNNDYKSSIMIGRMPTPHQAQIWSVNSLKKVGLFQNKISLKIASKKFNFELKIASDLNTFIDTYLNNEVIKTTNYIFCNYSKGGYSDKRAHRRILETTLILFSKELINFYQALILIIRFEISYFLGRR